MRHADGNECVVVVANTPADMTNDRKVTSCMHDTVRVTMAGDDDHARAEGGILSQDGVEGDHLRVKPDTNGTVKAILPQDGVVDGDVVDGDIENDDARKTMTMPAMT